MRPRSIWQSREFRYGCDLTPCPLSAGGEGEENLDGLWRQGDRLEVIEQSGVEVETEEIGDQEL